MHQQSLFTETPTGFIALRDPSVPVQARQRLSDQCEAILHRLAIGPATNDDLAKIARKYTGRVSDLRKAGYRIECFEQNHETGLTWYRLVPDGG